MVDIVHHGIIGLIGASALQSVGQTEMAVGFAVGSVAPDLDVIFTVLGKSRFLRLHQGFTHSPIGILALSLVISFGMHCLGDIALLPLLAGCAAGMALHVLFDLTNSFGVRVLWPSPKRVSLDAVFFVDVYLLGLSTATLTAIATGISPLPASICWALGVFAYVAVKALARNRIVRRWGLKTAVPSGVRPLTWFVTATDGNTGAVMQGVVRGVRRAPEWLAAYPALDEGILSTLRKGPIFGDLEKALKLFVPVSVEDDGRSRIVISRCVAVPNFGNRYGQTTSRIENGMVIDETSAL